MFFDAPWGLKTPWGINERNVGTPAGNAKVGGQYFENSEKLFTNQSENFDDRSLVFNQDSFHVSAGNAVELPYAVSLSR